MSRYLLLLFLFVASPTLYASQADASDRLDSMRYALKHLNFEGTFVYMNGKDMETMHVLHESTKKHERSYMTALSGEAREVLRDGAYLTCISPDKRTVFREPIRVDEEYLLPIPVEPEALKDYYRYELGVIRRIADLECQQVSIKPLDDLRFGYEYCIALKNGLPLRIATLDADGDVVEQVMFTSISFPESIDQGVFSVEERTRGFDVSEASKPELFKGKNPILFKELPGGFDMKSLFYQPASEKDDEFFQLILSDGLARVSLFVAPDDHANQSAQGMIRSGAVHAMVRYINGTVVTAVGEVPSKTLEVILGSVVLPTHD